MISISFDRTVTCWYLSSATADSSSEPRILPQNLTQIKDKSRQTIIVHQATEDSKHINTQFDNSALRVYNTSSNK